MTAYNFSRGAPTIDTVAADLLDDVSIEEIRQTVPETLLYKGSPEGGQNFIGYGPLRRTLAEKHGLGNDRRIITAHGGMDSMSYVLSYLTSQRHKSDSPYEPLNILAEAPTYDRFHRNAANHGINCEGIQITEQGLDLNRLENLLKTGTIKLFYGIPEGQNPTGYNYSAEERAAVESLCAEHGVLVLWDGAYWNLTYNGRENEPIKDPAENVIWSFNFTKELSAGEKNGYLVVPENLTNCFDDIVRDRRLNPVYPSQAVLNAILKSPGYVAHLDGLRKKFGPRALAITQALAQADVPLEMPNRKIDSGYFVQPKFLDVVDQEKFIAALAQAGVQIGDARGTYPPGSVGGVGEVRIPYATLDANQIFDAVGRIGQAVRNL